MPRLRWNRATGARSRRRVRRAPMSGARPQRRRKPTCRQDHWMDTAGDRLQLLSSEGVREVAEDLPHEPLRVLRVCSHQGHELDLVEKTTRWAESNRATMRWAAVASAWLRRNPSTPAARPPIARTSSTVGGLCASGSNSPRKEHTGNMPPNRCESHCRQGMGPTPPRRHGQLNIP